MQGRGAVTGPCKLQGGVRGKYRGATEGVAEEEAGRACEPSMAKKPALPGREEVRLAVADCEISRRMH